MPFSVVAWSESQDSATLLTLSAVSDPHIRTSADDVVVPGFATQILGAYAIGVNLTQAQLASPSLRRTVNMDLSPFDRLTLPPTTPRFVSRAYSPVPVEKGEALNALTAEDGAGATRATAIAILGDKAPTVDARASYTVRATGTTTLTAFSWTNVVLTFSQTLPSGKYDIVGAFCRSAGAIAFRLVIPGSQYRPGGIGMTNDFDNGIKEQRYGGWGIWGSFDLEQPPTIDVLSATADTTETVYIDLVKTA